MTRQIFTINPGSTTTKVALFRDEETVFSTTIRHDAAELARFSSPSEEMPYRREQILRVLEEKKVDLSTVDVFVGRGGGLLSMEGGTYEVTDLLLEHARTCANGVVHPATLGPQLAHEFALRFGAWAMVVNPPDVDELQPVARMTGIRGVYRTVHLHALNLKETAIRHSRDVQGKPYEECRYIVCHIGGGISVSAHCLGRMIDGYDIAGGEGPMAPTRCGSMSVSDVLDQVEAAGGDIREVRRLCTKTGGFVSWLRISDAVEVTERAARGDKCAQMVWDALIYQIEKSIGSMAAVLRGKVDAILLGGGMAHSKELVKEITECCSFIAPVFAYPGEFEMEAMASGALRVLRGEESLKEYTGKKAFTGFDFAKEE